MCGIGCPLVWLYAPFVLEVVQQLHVLLGATNVGMELRGQGLVEAFQGGLFGLAEGTAFCGAVTTNQ